MSIELNKLLQVGGVGPGTVRALGDAGYATLAQVAAATPEQLTAVKGIGGATAEAILAFVTNQGGGNDSGDDAVKTYRLTGGWVLAVARVGVMPVGVQLQPVCRWLAPVVQRSACRWPASRASPYHLRQSAPGCGRRAGWASHPAFWCPGSRARSGTWGRG